jgi:hypothetical protein
MRGLRSLATAIAALLLASALLHADSFSGPVPIGAAWTPSVVGCATSGNVTTTTTSGRYTVTGKNVTFNGIVTIGASGIGNCVGAPIISIPTGTALAQETVFGREGALTGKSLAGTIVAGASNFALVIYDNTSPAANNARLSFGGKYELA